MVGFGLNLAKDASAYSGFDYAQKTGKSVHIAGTWVQRDQAEESLNAFKFYVKDTLNKVELVTYFDPKPDNLGMAERVVIIGSYQKEGFVADQILTKCPSKYEEELGEKEL